MKSMFGGIVVAALVSPAFASEYWVQYDYSSHECSIVEKKSEQDKAGASQSSPAANPAPEVASAPTAGAMPTMLPGTNAPANTTVVTAPSGSPRADGTKPSSGAPATSGTPTVADSDDSKANPDDSAKAFFGALVQSWERKKAAAGAAGTADITVGLIGTAQHSREEAEAEMQIMRKCGIAN